MAAIPWKIRSEMQPAFDGALLDNQYVKGGIFIKKTKALRNAIGVLYRKLSSDTTTLCYVENDNIIYKLVNNPTTASTTDSDWEALSLSSSSLTPVGNWNADNTDPALTDAGAAGREGEFYFVTGAPTATDVTHAGLFGGVVTSVSDGMYVVSVGTAWIVVSNAATWDALSKPAAITDYVNGTVIEHEHTIAQVSGLSDALADKYDSSNTADHTIDFASVSDTAIIELEFLKTWYYSKTDIDSMIESTLAGNFWALEGITTLTEDATINANTFSLTFEGFTGGLFFNDTTGGGIFFNDTSAGGIFLDTAGGGVYIGDSAGGGITIEDLAGGYVDIQSIGSTGGGVFLWAQDSSTTKYAMLDLNSDYVYLELVGDDSIEMAINGMGSFLIGTGNNVIATDVFSRYNFFAGYDTVVSGIAGAYVQWGTIFGEAGTITSSKAGSTVNNPVILGGYFNAINLEATAAGVNQYASMYSPIIIGSQNVITNENSNGPLSNPMAIGYNLIVEGDLSLAMGYWGHILDDASGAFVHGFVTTIAQFGNHTGTVERVTAGGIHAVNISANSPSQVVGHGAYADYSAILGGIDHDIPDGSDRSVILGGNGIKARAADPDNVYVPYFNIMEIEQDDLLTQVLVRDDTTGKIYWRADSSFGGGGGGGGGWALTGTTELTGSVIIDAGGFDLDFQNIGGGGFALTNGTNTLTLIDGEANGVALSGGGRYISMRTVGITASSAAGDYSMSIIGGSYHFYNNGGTGGAANFAGLNVRQTFNLDPLTQTEGDFWYNIVDDVYKGRQGASTAMFLTTLTDLYVGDKDTDGSWRFVKSGDDLILQQREAGVYNTKHTFSGA